MLVYQNLVDFYIANYNFTAFLLFFTDLFLLKNTFNILKHIESI